MLGPRRRSQHPEPLSASLRWVPVPCGAGTDNLAGSRIRTSRSASTRHRAFRGCGWASFHAVLASCPMLTGDPTDAAELEGRVASATWNHTIQLPHGVVTPGEYDLRSVPSRVRLPQRLDGLRCIDVGTHDGFWAFAMEKRGAAEVVAIDVPDARHYDWPQPRAELTSDEVRLHTRRSAFDIAHKALGSRVRRSTARSTTLHPRKFGQFDVAVIGTLLLHLRDPVGALMAMRRVLRGTLYLNERVSVGLTSLFPGRPMAEMIQIDGAPFWWLPGRTALRRYLHTSGYELRWLSRPYMVGYGPGREKTPISWRRRTLSHQLLMRAGWPHVAANAVPRYA